MNGALPPIAPGYGEYGIPSKYIRNGAMWEWLERVAEGGETPTDEGKWRNVSGSVYRYANMNQHLSLALVFARCAALLVRVKLDRAEQERCEVLIKMRGAYEKFVDSVRRV